MLFDKNENIICCQNCLVDIKVLLVFKNFGSNKKIMNLLLANDIVRSPAIGCFTVDGPAT